MTAGSDVQAGLDAGSPAGQLGESTGSGQPLEAPVYATRLAPPATLHYVMQRGVASGHAVLRWAPEGDRYALLLRADLATAPHVTRASQGLLDAHGIAPERYAEGRRGRESRAVNFRRDRERITFSGPQIEHPLPAGAQDRLSWMLQVGAVLAANRSLEAAGQTVLLFVVGARGDADVWTFTVQGQEQIDLPGTGAVETVHLRREPRHIYDTLVELWLDPKRHHLPVRAHLTLRGERTQFVLQELVLP